MRMGGILKNLANHKPAGTGTRRLGRGTVMPVGLGCMNLSYAYGVPPSAAEGRIVLQKALDLGVDHFDSAALYGFGKNEELVGPFLKPHRDKVFLVSKGGMRGENGVRTIDNRPEKLRDDLENSLRRLQTDFIDLYYLHRYDKVTPIEDSVGELGRFVEQGKIGAIGLSEVSASTIRAAHATHPVAAVQSEYSLWSRNVEIAVLDTCAEFGITFVAFSPLARGFLTAVDLDPPAFADKDLRRAMPRFSEPNFSKNRKLLMQFRQIALEVGCTPAQLSLAWILSRGDNMHVIPGTTSAAHVEDNVGAAALKLTAETISRLDRLINQDTVSGPRYSAAVQADIDTEEF